MGLTILDMDNKKELFEKIVQILNSKLSDSQFKELINSCALLIYNHGYYGLYSDSFYEQRKEARRKQLYDLNYEMVKNGEISLEEYKKEFEAWFEGMYDKKYSKVDKFVLENNLVLLGYLEYYRQEIHQHKLQQ